MSLARSQRLAFSGSTLGEDSPNLFRSYGVRGELPGQISRSRSTPRRIVGTGPMEPQGSSSGTRLPYTFNESTTATMTNKAILPAVIGVLQCAVLGLLGTVIFFLVRHIDQFDELRGEVRQLSSEVSQLSNKVATAEQVALLSGAMLRLHWEGGSDPDVPQILDDLNKDLARSKAELVSANHPDSSANQEWPKLIVGDSIITAYASYAHAGAMALNYQDASKHEVVAPFDAIVARVGMATKFNTSEDMQKDETYLEVALEGETYGVDLWRFAKTFVKEGDSVKRGDLIGEVTSATEADSMLCLTVQVHRTGSSIPLDVSRFIEPFVEFTDNKSGH